MMINKRGYYENWFWWGFFFGVIAFIVAYLKPPYRYEEPNEPSEQNSLLSDRWNYETWICTNCNKQNPRYIKKCKCGMKRDSSGEVTKGRMHHMDKTILDAGGWVCSQCGTVNGFCVTNCKCGNDRSGD